MRSGLFGWTVIGASLVGATVWASLHAPASSIASPRTATIRPHPARSVSSAARPRSSAPASRSDGGEPPLAADTMPDLTQSDPRLGLPGDGASYCGPVAVSNGLSWLAEQGYPRLAPPGASRELRQLALVRAIARPRFMATNPTGGTGSLGLLRGLERWIADAGYRPAELAYAGWRAHDARHGAGRRQPDLPWLERALEQGGVAFLHVGWYRPPTRWELAHQRHGGHWVTVVRAIPSRAGVSPGEASGAAGELLLRDPAPYAGWEPALESVRVRTLAGGWLLADGDRIAARGAMVLGEGMRLKHAGDVAIVDGAVVLRLAPP